MSNLPRVLVWNEGRHEKRSPEIAKIYPEGIHGAISAGLKKKGLVVKTATLDDPDHGLTPDVLDKTDVVVWWGHMAHEEVKDEIVENLYQRIMEGLGLVVLHSGHFSKIFRKLMGTSCNLKWREIGEKARVWVVNPGHPVAAGIGEYFEIEHEEMYGEHFDIPAPDELVFVSWFAGGDVFRSGCGYYRGAGRVFYFQPGHETYPNYYQPEIIQVIYNAILWTAPVNGPKVTFGHRPEPFK